MSVTLAAIDVPFNDDCIKLAHVAWSDDEPTRVRIKSKRSMRDAIVEFDSVAGVRILDELDVAGLWLGTDKSVLRSSWLFEVSAGGWYDQESQRADFYARHQTTKPREFMIAGYSECVSIFAFAEPKVCELIASSNI